MATGLIDTDGQARLERVLTGIPGLDTILSGGFLQGGIYIVEGAPGTGKTILANQFCFAHAAAGHRAIYITLMSETYYRMLQHMQTMRFFEPARVPDAVFYANAFRTLEEDGLKGLIDLLRQEIRARAATLVVLDGFGEVAESTGSAREFKKFIHQLQAHVVAEGCTALLLTNVRSDEYEHHPEHSMVDGLMELRQSLFGRHAERELEILKLRGTDALRGRHSFQITDAGIVVYPRVEALLARPTGDDECPDERCRSGVVELDRMLGGGIPQGTTTLVLGASGSGKTTLGFHFLSLSSEQEPGLHFGFYEMPTRLRLSAARIGINLDRLIEQGHLETLWQPPTEDILDALGNRLLEAVRRRRVRRLVIDGLLGFEAAASHQPHRIGPFLTALANEFRVLNVTTICTAETRNVIGAAIDYPPVILAAFAENLILLRYVEIGSQLRRLLSVVKMRDSDFDPSLRGFRITAAGIELGDGVARADAILSGFPQLTAQKLSGEQSAHGR